MLPEAFLSLVCVVAHPEKMLGAKASKQASKLDIAKARSLQKTAAFSWSQNKQNKAPHHSK
jgi:hypothetical protein